MILIHEIMLILLSVMCSNLNITVGPTPIDENFEDISPEEKTIFFKQSKS